MILGIDTGSRRLALCWWAEDFQQSPDFSWYESTEQAPDAVLEDLQWWLTDQVKNVVIKAVYLEKVVMPHGTAARSFDTMMAHSMCIGMVLATVGGELITPATWKAAILGHGHADKDDTAAWIEHSAPQVAAIVQAAARTKPRRADLYDAYCIAAYGDLARRHPDQLDQGRHVPKRRSKPGAR